MTESVNYSSIVKIIDAIEGDLPHAESLLIQLEKYINNKDYFLMSEETLNLISKTLMKSGIGFSKTGN